MKMDISIALIRSMLKAVKKIKREIKSLKRGECLMFVGDDHILTKVESYWNHNGGNSNFYARASLMEVVFLSSIIATIVFFFSHHCIICFSINLIILLLVMVASYIQSSHYWRRFVKSKMRSLERKEKEVK